jgi:hypothetical protein
LLYRFRVGLVAKAGVGGSFCRVVRFLGRGAGLATLDPLEERARETEDATVPLVVKLVAFLPIPIHFDAPAVGQIERVRQKGREAQ